MDPYIVLSNHDESLVKNFRVHSGGYQPILEKIGARRYTVTGKLDNQVGPIVRRWRYTILCYDIEPTDPNGANGDTQGFGTLDHLRAFFLENTPPDNVIYLNDLGTFEEYIRGYAGSAISEDYGGATGEWTNLSNATGAPDGLAATLTLADGEDGKRIVLGDFDVPYVATGDVEEVVFKITVRKTGSGKIVTAGAANLGWDGVSGQAFLVHPGETERVWPESSSFCMHSYYELSSPVVWPIDKLTTDLTVRSFTGCQSGSGGGTFEMDAAEIIIKGEFRLYLPDATPVYLVGTFSEKNLSSAIRGPCASFLVPIEMVEVLT